MNGGKREQFRGISDEVPGLEMWDVARWAKFVSDIGPFRRQLLKIVNGMDLDGRAAVHDFAIHQDARGHGGNEDAFGFMTDMTALSAGAVENIAEALECVEWGEDPENAAMINRLFGQAKGGNEFAQGGGFGETGW